MYVLSILFIGVWWGLFFSSPTSTSCVLLPPSQERDALRKALSGDRDSLRFLGNLWADQGHKAALEFLPWIDLADQELSPIQSIFPQTHVSATILYPCVRHCFIAFPAMMKNADNLLVLEPRMQSLPDAHQLHAEDLYRHKPTIAFLAPYSQIRVLDTLRMLQIPIYISEPSTTVVALEQNIQDLCAQVGRPLYGQMMAAFVHLCFEVLTARVPLAPARTLYVGGFLKPVHPVETSLLGDVLDRVGLFPEVLKGSRLPYSLPLTHQEFQRLNPTCSIVESSLEHSREIFSSKSCILVDAQVFNSPTQFVALALYDLVEALQMFDMQKLHE